MYKKFYTLGLPAIAALAFAVVPASASAAKVTLESPLGTPLAIGAALTGTSNAATVEAANVLVFKTSAGNIECSDNVVEGSLTENKAATDTASLTSGSFTGEEEEDKCKTSTGLGPAVVTTNLSASNPWEIKFKDTGAAADVSSTVAAKVAFTAHFKFLGTEIVCLFEKKTVEGTFNINSAQVLTSFTEQEFTEKEGGCPTKGFLSGKFAITTAGDEPVVATT